MASPLGKLLGTSPIKPIQQHMQLAQDSVQGLCELLAACADGDWKRAGEIHRIIEGPPLALPVSSLSGLPALSALQSWGIALVSWSSSLSV